MSAVTFATRGRLHKADFIATMGRLALLAEAVSITAVSIALTSDIGATVAINSDVGSTIRLVSDIEGVGIG